MGAWGRLRGLWPRRPRGVGPTWRVLPFAARLHSQLPGVLFDAIIEAHWRQLDSSTHECPEALVRSHLRRLADQLSAASDVFDVVAVQDALNVKLAAHQTVPEEPSIELWGRVRLELPGEHAEAVTQYLRTQRDEAARQELERARLRFLREEIFSGDAQAQLWWMEHFPDRMDAITSGAVSELAERVRDTAPQLRGSPDDRLVQILAELVHDFKSPGERRFLVHAFVEVLRLHGRREAAIEVELLANESLPDSEQRPSVLPEHPDST